MRLLVHEEYLAWLRLRVWLWLRRGIKPSLPTVRSQPMGWTYQRNLRRHRLSKSRLPRRQYSFVISYSVRGSLRQAERLQCLQFFTDETRWHGRMLLAWVSVRKT